MTTNASDGAGSADRGFTLVEVLVVVIVIGILAGIAIPVLLGQRQRGRDAAVTAEVRNAATVAETITEEDPFSTAPFTIAGLEAAGWEHDPEVEFSVTGAPATGDLCISGHDEGGTTVALTSEIAYRADAGGMQEDHGPRCAPS